MLRFIKQNIFIILIFSCGEVSEQIIGYKEIVQSAWELFSDEEFEQARTEFTNALDYEVLNNIAEQANQRWPLDGIRIIHRVGELHATDQIVLVGVSSAHRIAAYEASQYIMDILKTEAPFWKKETTSSSQGDQGERWVDAKTSDSDQAQNWK
mgnify:CR=1 FL=1